MVTIPVDTPVTTPETDPTIAMPVDDELHEPPPTASLNVIVDPMHTCVLPVIAPGRGFTVAVVVVIHPLPIE